MVATHELPALEEEPAKCLQRIGEGRLRVLGRLRLHVVIRLGRSDLTRVLRELQRRIRRAREQRIERPDQIEHRVIDHRALARIGGIELRQAVLVAEVRHDRAALSERALRQPFLLQHRGQMCRVFREELGARRPSPDVLFFEVEARGAHEHAHAHVVDARLEDVQLVCSHVLLPAW